MLSVRSATVDIPRKHATVNIFRIMFDNRWWVFCQSLIKPQRSFVYVVTVTNLFSFFFQRTACSAKSGCFAKKTRGASVSSSHFSICASRASASLRSAAASPSALPPLAVNVFS